MIRLGCLGYGLWGRNLARVAASTPGATLVAIAELKTESWPEIKVRHPGVDVVSNEVDLVARDDIDAVLIATPAPTHADLAEHIASCGRHVFVEKPLAMHPADARRVVAVAEDRGVVLQVGHLMRYHPAVELLFTVARDELGPIRCVAAQRLNFGKVRADENVLFSLGPHDLSIMLELFGELPEAVSAHGAAFVRKGIEDLCFVTLQFSDGRIGQMHLSWLDPHKVRRVTVVGEKKMAVFDDMEPREKVRIYDQGVDTASGFWVYGESLSLRAGDIRSPSFPPREPLAVEMSHFVDCVRHGLRPRTDGADGLAVVEILAAAQESMRSGGVPVRTQKA